MKTLGKFLKQYNYQEDDVFEFAKDLTLAQFLETCERGDWILWLFARTNKDDLAKLTEAKALCANTVRHFMKDQRSTQAIDVALKFAKGEASRKELDVVAIDAIDAARDAMWICNYVNAHNAYAAYAAEAAVVTAESDAAAEYAAKANYAYSTSYAEEVNQKLTADICRQYLSLELWDQSKIK